MRNLYLFLSLYIASLGSLLQAQNGLPISAGARGGAMGNGGLVFRDINAAYVNQAGLAFVEHTSFSVFGERRFLMPGLNSFGFAAAHPLGEKIGAVGLLVQSFGYNAYNEQKIGLSYSRKLLKETSIGLQFNYLSTRIPDYGQAHTLTAELGFSTRFAKDWLLAGHIYNPFRARVTDQDRLPTLFKLGLGYQPSAQVLLVAGLEKDFHFPLRANLGIEYRIVEALALRLGLSNQPWLSSFGLGLYLQNLRLDFGAQMHPVLGLTPQFSAAYVLAPKVEKKASAE